MASNGLVDSRTSASLRFLKYDHSLAQLANISISFYKRKRSSVSSKNQSFKLFSDSGSQDLLDQSDLGGEVSRKRKRKEGNRRDLLQLTGDEFLGFVHFLSVNESVCVARQPLDKLSLCEERVW